MDFRKRIHPFFCKIQKNKSIAKWRDRVEIRSYAGALIGENNIYFVIFDHTGKQTEKWKSPSWRGRGCRDVLLHIIENLKLHSKNKKFCKVILSIPGEVNSEGICQGCTSLGWGKVNLIKIWAENSEIPVVAASRRNMLLLGEMKKQNMAGKQDGVHRGAIFLGENMETALLIDGKFIRDRQGNYSNLGKLPVYFGNLSDKQYWISLQEEVSYTEMEKKYRKLKKEYDHVLHSSGSVNDIRGIARTAEEGNPLAEKVIDEAAEAVVRGIACFTAVVALECVFICGKDSEINKLLKNRIQFLAERYELETAMYYTVPDVETEVAGCIDFTLFL